MSVLSDCNQGDIVRIVGMSAGRKAELNLINLGLNPGCSVEVLRRSRMGGPVLVYHEGTQIAIGRTLAQKIAVE